MIKSDNIKISMNNVIAGYDIIIFAWWLIFNHIPFKVKYMIYVQMT